MIARLTFLVLIFTLIPASALAQGDPEAVELFNQGREAIQRGDYNLACSKFEQSNALDKRVGTLLNLALCEEKRTRLVRALETWNEAKELAKRLGDEREKDATEHANALAPRVPKLTINLPADAPAGTKVRIEALTISARILTGDELGKPILVDPGKVNLIMITPEGVRSPKEITLAEGASETVTFESVPEGAEPQTNGNGDAGPSTAGGGDDTLFIAGLVVGIVGLAGVGVSLGLGAAAKSKNDESNDGANPHCLPDNSCNQTGLDLREDAIGLATGSTIAMVIGGIAVAAGVTLVVVSFTADGEEASVASRLRVGVSPTGASAQFSW